MNTLINFLKRILAPSLTDSEKRLIEAIKRERPKMRVVGNGTLIRIVTKEDNERFNRMAAELANLVGNGECRLCVARRGRKDP